MKVDFDEYLTGAILKNEGYLITHDSFNVAGGDIFAYRVLLDSMRLQSVD